MTLTKKEETRKLQKVIREILEPVKMDDNKYRQRINLENLQVLNNENILKRIKAKGQVAGTYVETRTKHNNALIQWCNGTKR